MRIGAQCEIRWKLFSSKHSLLKHERTQHVVPTVLYLEEHDPKIIREKIQAARAAHLKRIASRISSSSSVHTIAASSSTFTSVASSSVASPSMLTSVASSSQLTSVASVSSLSLVNSAALMSVASPSVSLKQRGRPKKKGFEGYVRK